MVKNGLRKRAATVALIAGIAIVGCGAAVAQSPAEVIYAGGDVVTINDKQPMAEAVAVRDGKIVAVGSREAVLKLRGPQTKMEDLAGRTLLPGFIDAHGHISMTGLQAVSANLLPPPDGEGKDIASLQRPLREYAQGPVATKYKIIIGFGYDDSQLKEKRHPTRQELDVVSKDLPIIIIHQSSHLAVGNTKALEMAKITAESKNPEGGVIQREADGKTPNGVLEETAFFAFAAVIVKPSPESFVAMLLAGQDLYARFGFTTGHDGRTDKSTNEAWVALAKAGKLKIDVVSYPDITVPDAMGSMATPWHSRTYTNGFRIGGVKLSLDGSPQGKTAYLTQPYFHPPPGQPKDYRGYPAIPDDAEVSRLFDQAYANNWQIIDTNGDAASDQMIAAVKHAVEKYGRGDRRTVMIHAQTVREDQLDAMKELGIGPSFFSMHTFYWGDWHREETLGPVRAERISPAMSALRRGMIFTEHHDAPVAFPDAIRVLSSAVTRRTRSGDILGADQRIPVDVALKSVTLWGAWQHFEEATKGSIEVGKLADFVILSENPLKIDPEKLSTLKVLETIKEGKTIYQAK